jgi:NHL repeat
MKTIKTLLLSVALCLAGAGARAQVYNFITLAGSAGVQGDWDGTNSGAAFQLPAGVAVDAGGNVYVADTSNQMIRKLRPVGANWVSSTIAGASHQSGSTDNTNGLVRFNTPYGLAVDSQTNLFVADSNNHTIRKLTPEGTNWVSSTIAGFPLASGSTDGTDTNSIRFKNPYGVAVGANGNVYVADTGNNTIRMLTPSGADWISSTIAGTAGTGNADSTDGTNGAIRFNSPQGIAVDAAGNLYIGDYGNDTIRKLTHTNGNWVSSTIGGIAGTPGTTDGIGSAALFSSPWGVAVDSAGKVYVADRGNSTIRGTTPPAPHLSTQLVSGHIQLFWSGAFPGYAVQTNSVMNNSARWSAAGLAVTLQNGQYTATDSAPGVGPKFYRLGMQ